MKAFLNIYLWNFKMYINMNGAIKQRGSAITELLKWNQTKKHLDKISGLLSDSIITIFGWDP